VKAHHLFSLSLAIVIAHDVRLRTPVAARPNQARPSVERPRSVRPSSSPAPPCISRARSVRARSMPSMCRRTGTETWCSTRTAIRSPSFPVTFAGGRLSPDPGSARSARVRRGATSFSENGYAEAEGARQVHQLRGLFTNLVKAPVHTFLVGLSLGALISVDLLQTFPTSTTVRSR